MPALRASRANLGGALKLEPLFLARRRRVSLAQALVVEPSELEVGAIVWARSVLATEGALERVSEVMSK